MQRPSISVSVVSHGHGPLVRQFLDDLRTLAGPSALEVIVTENIPEQDGWLPGGHARSDYKVIVNEAPRGFGANHNRAFLEASGDWFCVANPDIRLTADPFPALVATAARVGQGIVTPAVVNSSGAVEDHVRRFPTPLNLVHRRLGSDDGAYRVKPGASAAQVDWAAGMFLLMPAAFFDRLNGFDERFFMYCEDIDLSLRAWQAGGEVWVEPSAVVVHDAARATGRAFRHTKWHLHSMFSYFAKHGVTIPKARRREAATGSIGAP